MKNCILLAAGFFFAKCAVCQFNDTTHYMAGYAATGVLNKTDAGNSYVFSNILKFATRRKGITLNSTSSWIYGRQQRDLSNNDYTSLLDINLYKEKAHFYYWGLANFDKSYSLRIKQMWQAGVGIAYNFVDRETAFFNISEGVLYETANLRINDSVNNEYHTFRNSLRLRYRFVIKNIVLDATHFWQPSLEVGNDYIVKSNMSVTIKLKKWLNITTAAASNKVNRTHRENLLITYGLMAEKYF